jgi:hypothetical protein
MSRIILAPASLFPDNISLIDNMFLILFFILFLIRGLRH